MTSRSRAPSPPERGCARASRPTAPARCSSRQGRSGGRAAVTAAAASASALAAAATAVPLARADDAAPALRVGAPNPQVQAIRSRVNELVRRYDESLAEDAARALASDAAADGEDSDSDDDGRGRLPAQWKVGDVLLAAHSALARTGARTERAMVAELAREDPEVAEAMGRGEKAFEQALAAAGQRAQQTHAVLARSLAMVQQLQEEAVASAVAGNDAGADDRALQRRTRELRAALEVLSRDKQALLAQLQEQLKAHREALAVADQQGQALKRAQLALNLKAEELRALREDAERRAGEGSQALEAAQQLVSGWKDKQQLATKAAAAAETRASELETKCRALGEDLTRANSLLASKTQEADALRDAAKDSEAARLRAVSDAQAAAEASTLAKAQAESAASSRNSAGKRALAAAVEEATRTLALEKQALAERVEQAEAEARVLAAKLGEATHRRQQFENDNHELARVVREMQERARQQQQPKPLAMASRSSSFSISLRVAKTPKADSQRRKAPRRGSRPTAAAAAAEDQDDLSTTSESEDEEEQPQSQAQSRRRSRPKKRLSPEAEEAARDEAELNDTMHQVVESAFPRIEAPIDALEDDIAQFEDVQRSPMQRVAAGEPPGSAGDEVARVRAECAQELARMKTQYVAGLLEYKALVIEQYERRQGEERARHRVEIERLILLVQTKFRREMERRTQRVAQAQATLKLLYRAMVGRKGGHDGLSGVEEDREGEEDDDGRAEGQGAEAPAERSPVPLKSMLRAAIMAMSTSTKRSAQATAEISSIYEAVKTQRALPPSPRWPEPPTVVVSTSSKPATPPPAAASPPLTVPVAHVACQVSAADLERVTFAGGLRGSAITPEDMAGVVLPSAACFPRAADCPPSSPSSPPGRRRSRAELDFVDGALIAERLEEDVRRCLPRLPRGPHAVSPALRRLLLRQLVRFFAELQAPPPREEQDEEEEEEVAVVGSPRDTPFMRRKALEGLARGRRQRLARLIVHGGM